MTDAILILGANGNFGSKIARGLLRHKLPIIIAGRDSKKIESIKNALFIEFPNGQIESSIFDVADIDAQLKSLKPIVLINTCGPFQGGNYDIAKSAIENNCAYIDLADGRDFVVEIGVLNEKALAKNAIVISGASSVPGLSSAVIEHYLPKFSKINEVRYGIAPGQGAERGLATTKGILSYVGKPLKPFAGHKQPFGWQDLYFRKLPRLGWRGFANCDIPDLDIFPAKYGIAKISFGAGLELPFLHFGLWAISHLIRLGLPLKLENHAALMLKTADFFDRFGSDDGGMFVELNGIGLDGAPLVKNWAIIAKNGDGPQIPTIPAIILARKIFKSEFDQKGAYPCVGLVNLEEYLAELANFEIQTFVE